MFSRALSALATGCMFFRALSALGTGCMFSLASGVDGVISVLSGQASVASVLYVLWFTFDLFTTLFMFLVVVRYNLSRFGLKTFVKCII